MLNFTIDAAQDGILDVQQPAGLRESRRARVAARFQHLQCGGGGLPPMPATDPGQTGYHKVDGQGHNVNEPGKITVVHQHLRNGTPQYLVGATLTATAEDGDITSATQTLTRPTYARRSSRCDLAVVQRRNPNHRRDKSAIPISVSNDDDAGKPHPSGGHDTKLDGSTSTGERLLHHQPTPCWQSGTGTTSSSSKTRPRTPGTSQRRATRAADVGAPVTATGQPRRGELQPGRHGDDRRQVRDRREDWSDNNQSVDLDYEGESAATADADGSCADASARSPERVHVQSP